MPTQERQDLLNEANNLGLEFKGNISSDKLREMVAESKGPAIKEEYPDTESKGPAIKEEYPDTEQEAAPAPAPAPAPVADNPRMAERRRINDRKKAAMKTRIVTLTNKDNRENEFMTTCHLSVENQYFGVSKIVPLDIPVELEECLIDVAEHTMMTLHKDEIVRGQRTGNKKAVIVKKFAISYSQEQPA